MKKVVDLMAYKIEKALIESGFEVKMDDDQRLKLLIKINLKDSSN